MVNFHANLTKNPSQSKLFPVVTHSRIYMSAHSAIHAKNKNSSVKLTLVDWLKQYFDQSISQSVKQSINQSINQSVSQSVSQSVERNTIECHETKTKPVTYQLDYSANLSQTVVKPKLK